MQFCMHAKTELNSTAETCSLHTMEKKNDEGEIQTN